MRRFSRLFDKNYKKLTRIFENRNRKTSKQEQIFSKIAAEKWIIISSNFKNQDVNLNKLTSLLEDTDGKPRKIDVASRRHGWKNRKKLTQHLRNDNEKAQALTLNRDNKSGEPRKDAGDIVAGNQRVDEKIRKSVAAFRKGR